VSVAVQAHLHLVLPETPYTLWARGELDGYLDLPHERTSLYSIPDQGAGAYLHQETWEFGQTIRLPEPFGIELATGAWEPWA
jgi:hypothetical protein